MPPKAHFLAQSKIGSYLSGGILTLSLLSFFAGNLSVFAVSTSDSSVSVGNTAPIVSAVTVNNGSAITLTPNATTTIRVNFTVSDDNGCSNVFVNGRVTTTLYRSGIGSSCTAAYENCYILSTTTYSCVGTSSSGFATSTFDIYYFAQATDASSSYPSENWLAFIQARDADNASHTTSSAGGVELNTLLAFSVLPTSTSYGYVAIGSSTGGANVLETVYNAGNASTSLSLSGTAMASGTVAYLPTSSQRYATSSFTFGGNEQLLQEIATVVNGFIAPPHVLGGSWTYASSLPTSRNYRHASVFYNNYVYKIGGDEGDTFSPWSDVYFAQVNTTGSLSSWSASVTLGSTTISQAGAAAYNGFMYVVGGGSTDDANFANASRVHFGPINSTGSISNWQLATSLPNPRYAHTTVIHNGYIYVIGGVNPNVGLATTTVLFAPINSTGSIGSWATTTPLLATSSDHSSFVSGGRLYVVGGPTSTNFFAPINSTGSIGNWTTTTALPNSLSGHASVALDNKVYVFGGLSTSTSRYAPIHADGHFGAWRDLSSFSNLQVREHSAVVGNGYVYIIGGTTSTSAIDPSPTTTVVFAKIPTGNVYWGLGIHATATGAIYSGTITYTATFSP